MPAPKGNQYWKLIDPDNIGRDPEFSTPNDLWERCKEYFEWIDSTPIIETESTTSQGKTVTVKEKEHAKPYTWEGLYAYLGICNLDHYKKKKAFSGIISHISNIIYSNKFEGASAGLFNSNIIARDLGLKDSKDHTSSDGSMSPPRTLADIYAEENPDSKSES